MVYRTRTYIAADWDNDSNAVQQLNYWNDNKYFSLSFTNAHDLQQARDSSLNCSIKRSLGERLDASHTFVLIVGNNTKTVRSGRCQYCNSYNSYGGYCARGYSVDNRSYIEYECEKAVRDGLKIIVLYNAFKVDRAKCPDVIRNVGIHMPMWGYGSNGQAVWNYQNVKTALD